jgi:steroid 5-alpha reductase family enzyme
LRGKNLPLRQRIDQKETSMFDFFGYVSALPYMLGLAVIGWLISLPRRNVDVVDSLWSLMFLVAIFVYAGFPAETVRGRLLFVLVAIWALRLSIFITARNWGHEEDRRYQAIRARNQPNFAFSSVYRVFAFQAVLAWVISMPLHGAVGSDTPLGVLDYLGLALWIIGFLFEAGGDWQLSRPGQCRPGDGSRVLALHAPPQLFRRLRAMVGLLSHRRRRRRVVERPRPHPHDGTVAARVRRGATREGYR